MTSSNTQSNAVTGFADGSASNAAAHKPDLDKKYIVKHWLQPGHVGMLAAPPAHGKTAIVAALCANLALGHSFAGLNVRRTAIYYLAPEDPVGVKDRAYPYLVGAPVQVWGGRVSRCVRTETSLRAGLIAFLFDRQG